VRGFADAAVTDQWEQTVESCSRLLLQDSNTVPLAQPKAANAPGLLTDDGPVLQSHQV